MSSAEIVTWQTGVDLARLEVPDDMPPDQVAWATGVVRAAAGRGFSTFLNLSRADLALMLSPAALDALDRLGHDRWAYWVREGYEDARRQGR